MTYLPQELSNQSQNQIFGRAAQMANPAAMMGNIVGNRGIGADSGIVGQRITRQAMPIWNAAAGQAAGLQAQDALGRANFSVQHGRARAADLFSGMQNRLGREGMLIGNQAANQNILLQMLGGMGGFA